MKLLRFNLHTEARTMSRPGVLMPSVQMKGDRVADLRRAAARYLAEIEGDTQAAAIAALRVPQDLGDLLKIGAPARRLVDATVAWLDDLPDAEGGDLFAPLAECRLHAPLRHAGKAIAVGRNYGDHLSEMGTTLPGAIPSSWIKATSSIIGPHRDIVKPRIVEQLDYETELTVVIGKTCKNVPESRAYDVVAGYTVMSDISARDIVRRERAEGNQMLGKMFDSFAPQGPYLVTTDEVPDPMNLRIVTRVNGEVRQDGTTAQMIFSIPRLIAFLSQMTLEAGDVILTGTPSGVAMGRKPDPAPFFLQVGDVLETEIEGIGAMRHKIVDEPDGEPSWQW